MKFFLPFIFTILKCNLALCQDTSVHAIYWKPQMLQYADFRGPVDYSDLKVGARTVATLVIQTGDTLFGKRNDSLKITVTSIFFPDRSFFKSKNIGKQDVLVHEQLHFDIVEWYARQFKQQVAEADLTLKNFRSKIRAIVKAVFKDMRASQDDYDEQTQHGRLKDEQRNWNKKIYESLTQLKAFSDTVLNIKISP